MVRRLLDLPPRVRMIERLVRGPASVGQLAEPLAMSLPSVMQHLQVLEDSGLVRSRKEGRVRTCQVEAGALRTGEEWFRAQRTDWERRLDRLDAVLSESDDKEQP